MKVMVRLALLFALAGMTSACVVAPAPYYGAPRGVWVPGHYNAWGHWVPGHWR